MPPRRILHLITRLEQGGAPLALLETVRRLNPERFEVDVVAGLAEDMTLDISDEAKAQGFRIFSINSMRRSLHPLRDATAFLHLVWTIARGRYDLVHTHTSKAGVLGRIAARLCGVPRVVHSPHGSVLFGYFSPRVTRFYAALERIVGPLADRLVCLTRFEIGEYTKARIGGPHQYTVIPNGIDIDGFRIQLGDRAGIRRSLGIPENAVVFTTVGRLVPIKGHTDLLRAARLVKDAGQAIVLLIVGEGELRDELESEAKLLGIKKDVCFLGWRDDVAEILDATDVFILASHNEGLGLVLVEAMAKGLPVVATRVGGIPNVVSNGKTGLLVPPRSPDDMSRAMLQLIPSSQKRRTMGAAGRQRAYRYFSINATVRLTEKLYEELLSKS